MTSLIPRADIYDSKTLAVMNQVFAAIWSVLRASNPSRDPVNDSELLLNVVANGVTDPIRLRNPTVETLLLSLERCHFSENWKSIGWCVYHRFVACALG